MTNTLHKSFNVKCWNCGIKWVLIQRKRPRTDKVLCYECKIVRAREGAIRRAKDKANKKLQVV